MPRICRPVAVMPPAAVWVTSPLIIERQVARAERHGAAIESGLSRCVVVSLTSKPPLVMPVLASLMAMAVSVTVPTVRLSASV